MGSPHRVESQKLGPAVKVLRGWKTTLPVLILRVGDSRRFRVVPGKAFLWLLGAIPVVYFAAAGALFLNDRFRHGLQEVTLWDRLYPPRWPHYRIARGNSFIHHAQDAFARGDLASAAHLLRAGLARSPSHTAGRELLADIYAFAQRPDLAEAVLIGGLRADSPEPPPSDYLHRTVGFLFQRQRDDVIIELTARLLSTGQLAPPERTWLALARANAFRFRGNFDQAESTLQTYGLQHTLEGRILNARLEWERGFAELALALIEQLAVEAPESGEVYHLRVAWLAESGQTARARHVSLLRRLDRPDELAPRLDLLFELDRIDDDEAVAAESESLLQSFPVGEQPVLLLGDFAANTGRPAIADLACTAAERRGLPASALALMRVEARIVAGQYAAALELSNRLLAAHPDWESALAPIFNGLRAIAHFALGDRGSADLYLNNVLNQGNLRAENLVAVSQRLVAVGATAQARRVLKRAVELDALNQPALASLIEFELDAPDAPELSAHLARLLEMRRPPPALLRRAYATLGRDQHLFLPGREELLARVLQSLNGTSRTGP